MGIAEWAKKHHELTLSFIRDGMRDGRGREAPVNELSAPR
jgi:hypothetical protein